MKTHKKLLGMAGLILVAAVGVAWAGMIRTVDVHFRDGTYSTLHLSHNVTLGTGTDCEFTIEDGVLHTDGCTVAVLIPKGAAMVGVSMDAAEDALVGPGFDCTGRSIDGFLEAGCEDQGLDPPCSSSASTYPSPRITACILYDGVFWGLWVVPRS